MKRYGQPKVLVTDRLRSYRAALNVIGNAAVQALAQQSGRNSHQPFRRREGAMARFRNIKTLQKFAAALAQWRQLAI